MIHGGLMPAACDRHCNVKAMRHPFLVDGGLNLRDTCMTVQYSDASLNKEVRPFFLGDTRIWSFPSVSSLSDYLIWRS